MSKKSLVFLGDFLYNRNMILGIDEVGRGAWAGPLVVGACLLNNAQIDGLTDSKALTKKQREKNSSRKFVKVQQLLGWAGFQMKNWIRLD